MSGAAQPDAGPRRTVAGPRRRIWLVLHGWFALPIWILLLFVCASGTVACVSHEIAWLADARTRADNPDGRAALSFGAVADAAAAAVPGGTVAFVTRRASYLAAVVWMHMPDGTTGRVFVNPYTGVVQGVGGGLDFPMFMRTLHAWLLIPWSDGFSVGYYLVTLLCVPLAGSLITGVVVYRRFWRDYLRPRLRRRDGRVFWGDLHRLLAIWSLWFVAVLAVTSAWYLAQAVMIHAGHRYWDEPPVLPRTAVPTVAPGEPVPRIGIDAAIAVVKRRFPDLDVRWVAMPEHAHGAIGVSGRDWLPLVDDTAVGAWVDPYSGAVIASRSTGELAGLTLLDHVADPLHYGTFAGLWSKLVWAVFGLALTTLVASGVQVWTTRTARETAALFRGAPADAPQPAE